MGRKLLAALGLVVLSCGVLSAEFWDDKAFATWSDMELARILADSPWSHLATVVMPPPPEGTAPAPAARGGGGRGGARGGAARGAAPGLQLTVTWRTALPMKQALIRSQIGLNGTVPPASQGVLDQIEDAYAISVTGLPMAAEAMMDGVKEVTFLNRVGKAPIAPEDILSAPQPGGTVLMLAVFPRSAMIAVEDGEIEFVTKIGGVDIKRSFVLKEMVYKGKLEL